MPGSLFPPLWPSAAHTSSRPAKREPLEAYGAVTFDAVVAASSTGAAVPRFLFLSLFLVFFCSPPYSQVTFVTFPLTLF